jgi:hypothetical protein
MASILSALKRFDILVTSILFSPEIIGLEFKVQTISNGKSPLLIIQFTTTLSPGLNASSPNVNGITCGGTVGKDLGYGIVRSYIVDSIVKLNAKREGEGDTVSEKVRKGAGMRIYLKK